MSLYGRLYRTVWRWRAGRLGREIFAEATAMAERERWSTDELSVYQTQQLRTLLSHAYCHVPFWQERMDVAGLNPETVASPEDLAILPCLTKEEVRARGKRLVAATSQNGRLIANATGGSTGEPLHFWQDRSYVAANRAAKLRHRRWYGYDLGERIVYLWGAHRDTRVKSVRDWLRRRLRREAWVNAFELNPSAMLELAQLLNDWEPQLVVAYPSSMQVFARFLRQRDLSVQAPRAIECSAEKLWPEQRREIETALDVPVFDVYGSREFGAIAAECPAHEGLHVFSDTHVVEILRDGRPARPGELGEIVVTCLTNFAMPFIRYRTGDLGVLSEQPCSCGRTLPLLSEVTGRSNGVVSLPDGRLVHGAFFSYFFYHEPGVHRYRVRQPNRNELEILLEGDETLTASRLEGLTQLLTSELKSEIGITVRRVPRIEPLSSGKMGYLISEVPVDFVTFTNPDGKDKNE